MMPMCMPRTSSGSLWTNRRNCSRNMNRSLFMETYSWQRCYQDTRLTCVVYAIKVGMLRKLIILSYCSHRFRQIYKNDSLQHVMLTGCNIVLSDILLTAFFYRFNLEVIDNLKYPRNDEQCELHFQKSAGKT